MSDETSKKAVASKADIVQESGGARGELVEEVADTLTEGFPIMNKAMHVQDILTQPAPEFFDGIKPRRIGGQTNGVKAWILSQSRQHVWVGMNAPVVMNDVNGFGARVSLVELGVKGDDLFATDDVVVEKVHPPGQGIQTADGAPLGVVTISIGLGWSDPPHPNRGRPSIEAKFIQKDRFRVIWMQRRLPQHRFHLFELTGIRRVGAEQARPSLPQFDPHPLQCLPHPTHAHPFHPLYCCPNRPYRPAARQRAVGSQPQFLASRLTWPSLHLLHHLLLHVCPLLRVTSDDHPPAGVPPVVDPENPTGKAGE